MYHLATIHASQTEPYSKGMTISMVDQKSATHLDNFITISDLKVHGHGQTHL